MRWCSSALYTATSASSRPPSRRWRMMAACRASEAGPPRGASPPAFISVVVDRVPLEHFLLDVCGHVSELCWFVGRKDIESALFEQSNTIFHNISLSPRVARAANCQHRHIFHSLSARAAAARSSTTMMMMSTEVVAGAQHRRSGRVVARRERRKTAAIAMYRDVWVHETWPRNFEKMRLKVFYPKVLDQTAAIAFSQQGTTHIRGSCQDLHSLEGLSN